MKSEHYFTQKPTSRLIIQEIEVNARGQSYKLSTASGLFSLKRLDKGSELLINKAIINEKQKVLDLGCGYGIIGITLKRAVRSIKIYFSDINERAIKITKRNIKKLKLEGNVTQSDGLNKINDKDFDVILLNPPQTAGKKVCFKMIEDSKDHIKKGGNLQIVARHNKGGKELSKKMKEVFGNVEDVAKGSGYRVYISKN